MAKNGIIGPKMWWSLNYEKNCWIFKIWAFYSQGVIWKVCLRPEELKIERKKINRKNTIKLQVDYKFIEVKGKWNCCDALDNWAKVVKN